MPDHIHCLFMLNPKKSITEVIKKIKGSSSRYINQNNLMNDNFAWQVGYAAFSVSESVVERVYKYIQNQKAHHSPKTSQEEYNFFTQTNELRKDEKSKK